MTIQRSLFAALLSVALPAAAIDSVVTFSELQYHLPGPDQSGEWIELRSEMAVDVDLSGWRISGGVDFVFPEGTILAGGGFVVIAQDPSAPALSEVSPLGPFSGQLANGGETLNLRDRADRLMDTMTYRDRGGWPVAADGSGSTLAKKGLGLLSAKSVSWAASLTRTGTPGAANFPAGTAPNPAPGPVFQEVAPGGSPDFFIEVSNPTAQSLDLGDFLLFVDGFAPLTYFFPTFELSAGARYLLTPNELGMTPADGDRLFLMPKSLDSPTDARRVTGRLRGRAPGFGEAWLFPEVATPGEPNAFNLEEGVIINEICYNPPVIAPVPGLPPIVETFEVINQGDVWRYNESGEDLGLGWASRDYAVGGNWQAGPGILAFDTGLAIPVGTTLTNPFSNNPRVITYYFERDFVLSEIQAAGALSVALDYAVDDGAIFYLNGYELERFQMPDGPVTAETPASRGVGNLEFGGPVRVEVPRGLLVAGTNRFSVEVHQNGTGSNDVGFGLEVFLETETDPGRSRQPARSSDDQWVELYNRSGSEVDLSGWSFGEGIDFEFPFGTTLAAGGYLVVAKDPIGLSERHPGITILGPFMRSLSRGGETLSLRDANNNPADSLRYFDGGQWPGRADAGGSTLELRDPEADNALPGAWAASDELARTSWQSYSYRRVAEASAVGPDTQWRDFVFGMLEEGEILIDDIEVVEDPDGTALPFLIDGTFESGDPSAWRFLGNHREAEIIPDPDGGGNVLRLRATGSTGHMHNHVETTLANGEAVVNGREYEISFRARWLGGDNQLHTRLYFNRLPQTTRLPRPDVRGTPGLPNSTLVSNLGPTSFGLSHSPTVPGIGEPVTVTVSLRDPDMVNEASLHYRVDGGAFSTVSMNRLQGTEEWSGVIPGNNSGRVVQFYVEGVDLQGGASFVPSGGPDSRAMYQVEDGRAATTGINNIRIIMDPEDQDLLYGETSVMSNGRLGCTVIDREEVVYYDAGVRVKGSQRARRSSSRIGFNLGFPKDQLYRGVHRTVAIDRSEGQNVGQRELLFDLMQTSSGGIPGEHNDLCYVISPDPAHTSAAVLQLARFGSDFLESQFEDGDEGTVYEYELVYYPTTATAAGFKRPQPDRVTGSFITSLGSNPEDYRWTYLIKNNQENDNLDPMIRMTALFDLPNAEFQEQVDEVIEVEQWLRSLAYACATGAGDTFFSNSRHNGQFYAKPDGKVLFFPHDNDFAFQATRSITQNTELSDLIRDPAKRRRYLGHLQVICSTVYNQSWMQRWTTHFDTLVPGGAVFNDDLNYINSRSNFILNSVSSQVPQVEFSITTNGGADFVTDASPVVLVGEGWVNVNEIRLAGSEVPLPVVWTTSNDWEVSIALAPGENAITLEAYDFSGVLIGSDSITVDSTGGNALPSMATLVVSEIFYNPGGVSEGAEYLEFLNISASETLDLSGVQVSEAVDFVFPGGVSLAPGERVVVVSNSTEFVGQFGGGLPVAGVFENQLSNGGETITIRRADGSLLRTFAYSDDAPWPTLADGSGASLLLVDPFSAPDHGLAGNWRASGSAGVSPGTDGNLGYATWKEGFGNPADGSDPDGDGWTVLEEFVLGGSPTTVDKLEPLYSFDEAPGFLTTSVTLRVDAAVTATLESSETLLQWNPEAGAIFLGSERATLGGVEVDRMTYAVPIGTGEEYFRFLLRPVE